MLKNTAQFTNTAKKAYLKNALPSILLREGSKASSTLSVGVNMRKNKGTSKPDRGILPAAHSQAVKGGQVTALRREGEDASGVVKNEYQAVQQAYVAHLGDHWAGHRIQLDKGILADETVGGKVLVNVHTDSLATILVLLRACCNQ